MAHLRFQDLPPSMRAKVAQQLGMSYEEASGTVTTYSLCLSIGGSFTRIKSTSATELAKVLDELKQKHPLIPYSILVTERIADGNPE